ncbi:carboxypeptidase-like regulatory domain-containing protein [Pontibacter silvestris]|uniref:Carboxypeptidase-like regulatory domain-containing protein n=1 Tax=Pontibacter silvestris TaxID=2305183 RepID=A0ABW4WSX3_9BACT|nr:carboxypeptidase-like regulatory domain-containing protein [Pontibacter silvestris]
MRKYFYIAVNYAITTTCINTVSYAEDISKTYPMVNISSYASTVTGKVTSEEGEPLIGASVALKGSSTVIITDARGNYTIVVPDEGGTFVVSYIGFVTKEVSVAPGTTSVNITLNTDAKALEEVVVIGYGEQKKSVVTGAISKVGAEDLENMPVTRVEQALQGRTSGLTITSSSGQPGAASTVRVRGTTTITTLYCGWCTGWRWY